jgi:hypothetical protein
MSKTKAKWGIAVNAFFAAVLAFVPMSEFWKIVVCLVAVVGMVLCIIGYFMASEDEPAKATENSEVVAPKQSGNIVTAGRDINLHHYTSLPMPEVKQALPDFFYDGNSSQVTIRFTILPRNPDRSVAVIKFLLRFENRGQATAYNVGAKLYGCWIHGDPVEAVLIDTADSVGRTAVNQGKGFEFTVEAEPDSQSGLHSLNIRKNTLVVLIEIHFGVGPDDFASHKNDPIWLTWNPELRNRTADSTPADISIAKPLIDGVKGATPPLAIKERNVPLPQNIINEKAAEGIQIASPTSPPDDLSVPIPAKVTSNPKPIFSLSSSETDLTPSQITTKLNNASPFERDGIRRALCGMSVDWTLLFLNAKAMDADETLTLAHFMDNDNEGGMPTIVQCTLPTEGHKGCCYNK